MYFSNIHIMQRNTLQLQIFQNLDLVWQIFEALNITLRLKKSRHIDLNREFRDCIYCTAVLEDEFHFILICPLYSNIRSLYIPKYFVKNTTLHKFYGLICQQKVIKLLEIQQCIYTMLLKKEIDYSQASLEYVFCNKCI